MLASWVKLKNFWGTAVASEHKSGENQENTKKMLTIISLSSDNWELVKEGKLQEMINKSRNSIPKEVYEHITDPNTGEMNIDLNAILDYIARQYDKLGTLDKIKITEDVQTYGVISDLFSTNKLAAGMDGYDEAKKAWTAVDDYCYKLAMNHQPEDKTLYTQAEMIMRLLTGKAVDDSVKSEIENLKNYVISYNSTATNLMSDRKEKQEKLKNDYLTSYPALTDVKNSDYSDLKRNTKLYHIARVYLGLENPIENGIETRKSALLEGLKEIGLDYTEKDIELVLNFIEPKKEDTPEQKLKEQNKALKECTNQVKSLTEESGKLKKELDLTVTEKKLSELRDQMHTRIVAVKGSVLTVLMTLSKIINVLYPLYEQCKAVLTSQGQKVPEQVKLPKHEFKSVMTVLDFVCHLHGYINALLDNKQEINHKDIIIGPPTSYKHVIEVLQSTLNCKSELYKYDTNNK